MFLFFSMSAGLLDVIFTYLPCVVTIISSVIVRKEKEVMKKISKVIPGRIFQNV